MKTAIVGYGGGQLLIRGDANSCDEKCKEMMNSSNGDVHEKLNYFRCYSWELGNSEDVTGKYHLADDPDVDCESRTLPVLSSLILIPGHGHPGPPRSHGPSYLLR